jgi:hypothetical protein
MTDLVSRLFPDDSNWKLLRTLTAVAGPTFSDDTDYAGGTSAPPLAACVSVPSANDNQSTDLGLVVVCGVITTAAGAAIVARGTCTFSLTVLEIVGPEHCRLASTGNPAPLPIFTMDGVPLATVPPQRKVRIDGRGIQRMGFRLSTFVNVPGTAVQFHLLVRLE